MRTYFFDLDGTLSDSRGGLYLSFRAGLSALGIAPPSDSALAPFLGAPLPVLFRAVVPGIDADQITRAMAAFRAAFDAEGVFVNTLYPGALDLLDVLAARGGPAWIVTSKPEVHAWRVVDHLALRGRIAGVVGAGPEETDTKQTLIARALALSGARPADTVMLGDRHYDVTGALANGVMAVGALWGYGTRGELEAAGCERFAEDVAAFRRDFVARSSKGWRTA